MTHLAEIETTRLADIGTRCATHLAEIETTRLADIGTRCAIESPGRPCYYQVRVPLSTYRVGLVYIQYAQ